LYAVGAVRALFVVGDFGAERAAREGMRRIASDADGAATFDRDEHRARVGTIVRAGRANYFAFLFVNHTVQLCVSAEYPYNLPDGNYGTNFRTERARRATQNH
jgi:hypothetical protein